MLQQITQKAMQVGTKINSVHALAVGQLKRDVSS